MRAALLEEVDTLRVVDDVRELAAYCRRELSRSARGVVVCNPIPEEHELEPADWRRWLAEAQARAAAAAEPAPA